MENLLTFSQVLYYFVASFAIVILGLILCVITYYIIHIGKRLNRISENIEKSSAEVRENIADLFDKLSDIPFLSLFFKKGRKK